MEESLAFLIFKMSSSEDVNLLIHITQSSNAPWVNMIGALMKIMISMILVMMMMIIIIIISIFKCLFALMMCRSKHRV